MELMECVLGLQDLNENASALLDAADGFDHYAIEQELADRVIRGTTRNKSSDEAMRSLADDLRSGAWRPKMTSKELDRFVTPTRDRLESGVPARTLFSIHA